MSKWIAFFRWSANCDSCFILLFVSDAPALTTSWVYMYTYDRYVRIIIIYMA